MVTFLQMSKILELLRNSLFWMGFSPGTQTTACSKYVVVISSPCKKSRVSPLHGEMLCAPLGLPRGASPIPESSLASSALWCSPGAHATPRWSHHELHLPYLLSATTPLLSSPCSSCFNSLLLRGPHHLEEPSGAPQLISNPRLKHLPSAFPLLFNFFLLLLLIL